MLLQHIMMILIHYQDGSTVDIRRLIKINNLTKKQRMKQWYIARTALHVVW